MRISRFDYPRQPVWPGFGIALGTMKNWMFLSLTVLLSLTVSATTDDWSDNLNEADRDALDAIVLYPADVRQAILIAGTRPEILVRIERIQLESQSQFETRLQPLDQKDQEAIWEMTRYPGLLEEISRQSRPSEATLQNLAARYDAAIQPTVIDQGQRNFDIIASVQQMQQETEGAYTGLLNPYPADVQQAYAKLIGMPELLEILTSHLSLAVLVSDLYRQNPAEVNQHLDALAIEAADRQAQALEDWQAQLENDPEMRSELESAAAEFAQEEGWSADEYSLPPVEKTVEIRYVYEPYPYWFGYPRWYPYPNWYPYPWWYHWGFYFGPRGSFVVFGMPTYTFWGWYYGNPYHHYYYPHLTNGCVTYYHAHRRTGVAMNEPTRAFIARGQTIAGKDWLDEPTSRVDRIRDYGKLEMDFAVQQSATDRAKTRTDLLRENPKKYPALSPPSAQAADPDRVAPRPAPAPRPAVKPVAKPDAPYQQPNAQPTIKPTDKPPFKPTDRPAPAPAPAPKPEVRPGKPAPQPAPPVRSIERPKPDPSPVIRPEDYHKGTWNRPEPSRPAPSVAPSRPSAPPPAIKKPEQSKPRTTNAQPRN